MTQYSRASLTAVLGPTNTGKTHLAVERLCAHSSGMMGFPLRLLAREVYDRVVAIKGAAEVALITGEEKIEPPQARWYLCTAESMPLSQEREFAFVAVDEAQLGTDPERGHIFTDRLLRARGREETMILGSAALSGIVRSLLPEAEIISRPRFSTLSYAGAKKLSRLPKRSAIVAFSAEEVYAVAEMLRRLRGGAAVVMGALSPSTRNAQVRMFMEGEVDYLVATDAIGMGLNLDVHHVAFASLRKFDGHRTRRLTISEMAQIAGRAGRHQRDGTFGSLGGEEGEGAFRPEEITAIEEHRFPPVEQLYWRDGTPPLDTGIDGLIAALEARPDRPGLRAAPEVVDLAVLKAMADEADVRARVRSTAQVRRLWDVCGLPDFQKLGPEHHRATVARLWRFLSEGNGHIPQDWFAQNVARLDNVQGDVDTLSGRIAAARTWAYIAHRQDWLEHPAEMAERTRALEEKLSDALHAALTQRFVDRRTSVLLRDIGRKNEHLPVDIDADGSVHVDGEPLGSLHGFRFRVDPQARGGDRKLLLAAAERRLGKMLTVKAEELIAAPDGEFALVAAPGDMPSLSWREEMVASLHAGPSLLHPEVRLDKAVLALGQDVANRVTARLQAWMKAQQERHLAPLLKILELSTLAETPAVVRALLIQLADSGGIMARHDLDDALNRLDKEQRQIVRKAGFTIGVLDIFHHALLKPGAALWRLALMAIHRTKPMLPSPPAGAVVLTLKAREELMGAARAGYRSFGETQIRIDMIERIARGGHEAIAKNERYDATSPFIVSLGLSEPLFNHIMRGAGFRAITPRPSEAAVGSEPVGQELVGSVAEAVVVLNDNPNELPPIPPSEDQPGETPAETPPLPDDPAPPPVPEEFPAAEPTEIPAADPQPTPDSVPEALVASGANWVFRGRHKPRDRQERTEGGRQGKAPRSRHPGGAPGANAGPRGPRPQHKPDRGTARITEPARPAGGGAFAGLAALLGREE
ncbi:MAG: helicase [Sphingobium sp.]|jgi:ATP-dependent RNA helicase SUPV3L1/SUV3|nr:helicase [Sphingobium sp.]MCI1271236.1 helicase [Sphingobium sp.]MCI1756072.1 helicase [Sphingobium sp.]MCI2052647.1 helicase [Sphingobium sp.]